MISIHLLSRDGSHLSLSEDQARHLFETGALPSESVFWEPGRSGWKPVSELITRLERQRDRSHYVPAPSRLKDALELLIVLLLSVNAIHLLAELGALMTLLLDSSWLPVYAELQRHMTLPVLLGVIPLHLVIFVTFLFWVHRAVRFASALGAEGLHYTPGAAVWSFLTPFFNLWRPFRVLTETWQASVDPCHWRTVRPPTFLAWFWLFWTSQVPTGLWGGSVPIYPRDLAGAVTLGTVSVLSTLCGTSAIFLLLLFVVRLGRHQIKRSEEARRLAATRPPRGLFD
jgi:hypothetical protein